MAGELRTGKGTTVNIGGFELAGVAEVQGVLYQALAPFPEARVAAAGALSSLGYASGDGGHNFS